MIVADTTVWIDFLRGRDSGKGLADLLEIGNIIGLSLVFGELLQGVKNDQEKEIIENYWEFIPKIDEDGLAIRAGKRSYREKFISKGVGLIDSAILLAAEENKAKIWTFDTKFLKVIPKQLIYSLV